MKKNKSKGERCVLYDRECIGCGECEFCDLDPLKICDNCGKCLNMDDFASIKIDSIDGNEVGSRSGKAAFTHNHMHTHTHDDCCCDDDCDCGDDCGDDCCCDDDCGVLH